jgi:competence protein ComEA
MSRSLFTGRQSLLAIVLGCAMFLCSGALQAGPVNINTADAATLAKELSGVGLKRAEAIVEYRQKHGPFKSADELALVKGIGPAAVAKNRELIRIDGGKASAKAPAGATTSLSE